jgi:hypothetical protein
LLRKTIESLIANHQGRQAARAEALQGLARLWADADIELTEGDGARLEEGLSALTVRAASARVQEHTRMTGLAG